MADEESRTAEQHGQGEDGCHGGHHRLAFHLPAGGLLPRPAQVVLTNGDGQLTVLTTGGNLHYYDVSSCRLFPGFSDGAPATLSATFAVSPKQAITSP